MRRLSVLTLAAAVAPLTVLLAQPAMPAIPNQVGKIITVLGAMDPAALGPTLMHEHIFIEFQDPRRSPPKFASAEAAAQWNKPLTLATLSRHRRGLRVRDANFLGDFDESYAEVMSSRSGAARRSST